MPSALKTVAQQHVNTFANMQTLLQTIANIFANMQTNLFTSKRFCLHALPYPDFSLLITN
jgi:hypothetical protein